jgi:spermidine/putrescine transport system substrate-binding protein
LDDLRDLLQSARAGGLTRRQLLERAAALGLAASAASSLLAACGSGTTPSTTSSSPAPLDTTKPSKLSLYNWQNEIAPVNKKKFEQTTGIRVVETYYQDNEALMAKLKGGARGWDLIVPSGYAVSNLAKSGLLEPLDMTLIPNFKNVIPKFQKPSYDSGAGGKKFSVPWIWGDCGIAWRTDKLQGPITRWADLWNPRYKNRINMLDDEREDLGNTLIMLGHSYNSTSQSELDQATEKLIEQKPLVRAYDSTNMQRNIVAGTPLVMTWNGDAMKAAQELPAGAVQWVLPQEGYSVWVDNICIPAEAPSPYWAHKFIDFMCEAQNAADLINYVQYYSPNAAAVPYIKPELLKGLPDEATMARAQFQDDLGAFGPQYDAAWTKVQSA